MTIDDPAAVSPGEICDLIATLPSDRRWLGILTGWRGRGKTTWCSALASVARARGLAVAGLLSPGIFDTNSLPVAERIKLRIDLVDLATGYSRVLATPGDPHAEGHGMRWHFIQETIAWGNAALSSADAATWSSSMSWAPELTPRPWPDCRCRTARRAKVHSCRGRHPARTGRASAGALARGGGAYGAGMGRRMRAQ